MQSLLLDTALLSGIWQRGSPYGLVMVVRPRRCNGFLPLKVSERADGDAADELPAVGIVDAAAICPLPPLPLDSRGRKNQGSMASTWDPGFPCAVRRLRYYSLVST